MSTIGELGTFLTREAAAATPRAPLTPPDEAPIGGITKTIPGPELNGMTEVV